MCDPATANAVTRRSLVDRLGPVTTSVARRNASGRLPGGEPCEGELQARFGERALETEPLATAPVPYFTPVEGNQGATAIGGRRSVDPQVSGVAGTGPFKGREYRGMIGSGRGGELGKRNSVVVGGRRGVAGSLNTGRIGGSNGGQEGPAFQGLAQAVQDRQAMLLDGRDVPTDAAEVGSGVRAAERAGDLLLDLDHADVAFRLVVAEGHAEVV